MTPSPESRAEGICAALARAEAAFDKRGWVEMPKADRGRYVQRAMLAKPLIAAAFRDAENAKLEEAAVIIDAGRDVFQEMATAHFSAPEDALIMKVMGSITDYASATAHDIRSLKHKD